MPAPRFAFQLTGLLVAAMGPNPVTGACVAKGGEGADFTAAITSDASLGEAIFRHNWARPETWDRPETTGKGGDGLGPVFNDVSCVACHSLGGVGGAGDNGHNIQLLSLMVARAKTSVQRITLLKRARTIHPQLTLENPTVMLHKFGFGVADETYDYDSWREAVVQTARKSHARLDRQREGQTFHDVPLRVSERSTPALWGAGIIDRLRRTNGETIRFEISAAQIAGANGVSGRTPRTPEGRSGWFGWRGQVAHLPEFVTGACANELGLAVSGHPQPDSPRDGIARKPARRAIDLTDAEVSALERFVATLPRPQQVLPDDPRDREAIAAGENIFAEVGCSECHVRDVGLAKAVFSDFLLHDMGDSLADPVTAFPDIPTIPPRSRSNYLGGSPRTPSPRDFRGEPVRLTHEWRTPPLWGVADSPPYLHDGRAETLDEAIREHDGEARRAADAYRALSEIRRQRLLTFLGTLRAPQ